MSVLPALGMAVKRVHDRFAMSDLGAPGAILFMILLLLTIFGEGIMIRIRSRNGCDRFTRLEAAGRIEKPNIGREADATHTATSGVSELRRDHEAGFQCAAGRDPLDAFLVLERTLVVVIRQSPARLNAKESAAVRPQR